MSVIERLSLTFPHVQIKPTLILIYKNTVWTQLWSAVVSHFQELWWLVWSPGHAEEGPHAQPLSPGLVHRFYAARTREGACQVSCQSDKQKIKWTVLCCEPAKMGRHGAGTAKNRSGSTTTLRLFLTRKNGKPSSFTADPNSSRSESYTNLGWGCITKWSRSLRYSNWFGLKTKTSFFIVSVSWYFYSVTQWPAASRDSDPYSFSYKSWSSLISKQDPNPAFFFSLPEIIFLLQLRNC